VPETKDGLKYGKGTLIPAKLLKVVTERGRKDFAGVPTLMESIKQHGLIHPLAVAKQEDGTYNLMAGESRLRALLILGWTEIPCTNWDEMTPVQQKEIELEENLKRCSLEWSEEIETLRQLDELKRELHGEAMPGGGETEEGWTQAKTAQATGKSKTAVSREIAFATKLKNNPDLKEQVKGLPLRVAMKVVAQKEKAQNVARLQAEGLLKVATELKHGDALVLIKDVEDDSVDLLLTDPPFGIQELTESEGKSRGSVQSYTTTLSSSDNADTATVMKLMAQLIPELYRILVPSSHFYMFFGMDLYGFLTMTLKASGFEVNPVPLIWDKGRTTAPFRGYDYSPCYEPILYGCKPPRTKRLAEPGRTIITVSPDSVKDKIHPFQKPLELLDYFIGQSSTKGELVFDPFAGSGRTLKAAQLAGRSASGFELDELNYKKAQASLIED